MLRSASCFVLPEVRNAPTTFSNIIPNFRRVSSLESCRISLEKICLPEIFNEKGQDEPSETVPLAKKEPAPTPGPMQKSASDRAFPNNVRDQIISEQPEKVFNSIIEQKERESQMEAEQPPRRKMGDVVKEEERRVKFTISNSRDPSPEPDEQPTIFASASEPVEENRKESKNKSIRRGMIRRVHSLFIRSESEITSPKKPGILKRSSSLKTTSLKDLPVTFSDKSSEQAERLATDCDKLPISDEAQNNLKISTNESVSEQVEENLKELKNKPKRGGMLRRVNSLFIRSESENTSDGKLKRTSSLKMTNLKDIPELFSGSTPKVAEKPNENKEPSQKILGGLKRVSSMFIKPSTSSETGPSEVCAKVSPKREGLQREIKRSASVKHFRRWSQREKPSKPSETWEWPSTKRMIRHSSVILFSEDVKIFGKLRRCHSVNNRLKERSSVLSVDHRVACVRRVAEQLEQPSKHIYREYLSSNANPIDAEFAKRNEEAMRRKEKYFSERRDKNIFMKIIHPSYHQRNQVFKKLFVEKGAIPKDDIFLASYSCAYQREILAQGRMYLSQSHVCFYANIIGWETNLAIPLMRIKAISKQKAAYIFPNSLQIETTGENGEKGEKYFFATFANRDKSYQILTTALEYARDGNKMKPEDVWEMLNIDVKTSPSLENGLTTPHSIASTNSNHSTEKTMTKMSPRQLSATGSILSKSSSSHSKFEKDNCSQSSSTTGSADDRSLDEDASFSENLNAENATDDSTTTNFDDIKCPCEEHPGRLLMDAVFPMTLNKIFTLLFTDHPFFDRFNDEMKYKGYVASPWARDKSGHETRSCTYTVALNHAMAPKSCIVNEKQVISHFPRREDGFVIFKETQNSGVPYADNFVVQCTYCINRTSPTECRVRIHGGIVYKKGIWGILKGVIEKGTNQGLDDYYHMLERMLNEESRNLSDDKRSESLISVCSNDLLQQHEELKIEEHEHYIEKTVIEATQQRSVSQNAYKIQSSSPTSESDQNIRFLIYGLLTILSIFLISNFVLFVKLSQSAVSSSSHQELLLEVQHLRAELEQFRTKNQ